MKLSEMPYYFSSRNIYLTLSLSQNISAAGGQRGRRGGECSRVHRVVAPQLAVSEQLLQVALHLLRVRCLGPPDQRRVFAQQGVRQVLQFLFSKFLEDIAKMEKKEVEF